MLSLLKDYLTVPLPLLLLLIFSYTLYVYLTSTFDYWPSRGVPHRRPIPLFGNFADLLLFRKSPAEAWHELYSHFPDEAYFGAYRVRAPLLVLRDLELVKRVCIKDFAVFCNRGIPVNEDGDPLSRHLFNLEGRRDCV